MEAGRLREERPAGDLQPSERVGPDEDARGQFAQDRGDAKVPLEDLAADLRRRQDGGELKHQPYDFVVYVQYGSGPVGGNAGDSGSGRDYSKGAGARGPTTRTGFDSARAKVLALAIGRIMSLGALRFPHTDASRL